MEIVGLRTHIKAEARNRKGEMTGKTHVAKDDIKEDKKDGLEAVAESAGRYARKVLEQGSHVSENVDSVASAIREEPVKASLIALGIGVVLGMIFKRH